MRTVLLFFWLALLPPGLFSQTITDTLWSSANLDGDISYFPANGSFLITSTPFLIPGDGWSEIFFTEFFTRSYLSFNLLNLPPLDSIIVIEAIIGLYQRFTVGNDQLNTYPIWNVAGGDTHFCVLDHVDYGPTLDLGDWTAGDPGDPQTMHTNIGIISDTVFVGYQTMDVTPYVQEDVAAGRQRNQYRVRFTIDTDNDSLDDVIYFSSGNAFPGEKPYLIVRYERIPTGIHPQKGTPIDFSLQQNFPNPFNSSTLIVYYLMEPAYVLLEIFDRRGALIETLVASYQAAGNYQVRFHAQGLASGIYYYRLRVNNKFTSKKMLLIR